MLVVKDFAFDFDPLLALRRRGRDSAFLISRGKAREAYEAALVEVRALIQPAFAYSVHPVLRAEADRLLIANGEALESVVVASLFGGAPEVVLLAYTIGPALDVQAEELRASGNNLASYMTNVLGSLALQEVGQVAYGHIEDLARAKGLRASIPLNPGTSHWPFSGQRVFEKLCPLTEIGITVTSSNLLTPFKSISMAIALGAEVLTPDRGSSCDYCETRHLCDNLYRNI